VILDFADGSPKTTRSVDHWRIARDLLEMVMPDIEKYMRDPGWIPRSNPAGDEHVRAWYKATTALLLMKNINYPRHFDIGLALFPDDSDVLFHAASLHDRQATPQVQAVAQAASLPPGIKNDVRSSGDERRRAETLFRRVLDRAGGHTEARLRLGHILARSGRSRDAVRELRRVVDEADEPLLRYYGALFLGDAAEAMGDFTLARKSYEDARALYPRAQSPSLALSHLSSRNGDNKSAVVHLAEILKAPLDPTLDDSDPWWEYYDAAGRKGPTRLAELYNQARAWTRVAEQKP
jgi:tetratricopeptide (TPR) repeat protein